MARKFVLLLALLTIGALSPPRAAHAAQISRRNPYRSFNISGINYGSMQWERQHRRRTTQNRQPFRRGWFRQGWIRRRR